MLDICDLASRGELFDGQYFLIRPLSEDGATADVWVAIDANTVDDRDVLNEAGGMSDEELSKIGLVVAIKIYRPQNALDVEGVQRFKDEYMMVFNCHHSNLIHPTHFSIFKDTPYLVLPYCRKGSSELLAGNLNKTEDIWRYVHDVAAGLAYLHECVPPIIHQDIKPANILLDDTNNYAITDFGISTKSFDADGERDDGEISGTLAYMAPERFKPDYEPVMESDIWALGATVYELMTGRVPFGEEGGHAQSGNKVDLAFPQNVGSDIRRLVAACLDHDPKRRPTAENLVQAAEKKQFPVRRFTWRSLAMAVAVMTLMIVGGGLLANYMQKSAPVLEITQEEAYGMALEKMNTEIKDSLAEGIRQMEDLANKNYVPALWQLALTYGWFDDEASVGRKQLLGIELGYGEYRDELFDVAPEYLPKDVKINRMAVDCFRKIVDIDDGHFVELTMKAAGKLGSYYLFYNFGSEDIDLKHAKEYYEMAEDRASELGMTEMKEKIEQILSEYNL